MDLITTEISGRLLKIAADELINAGISPVRLGYTYILRAVTEIIVDDSLMVGITKTLYPRLANRYCTSSQAVERNIRSAIEAAYKNANCEKRITNKEFIFKTVNRVKKHLEISNNDEY